MEAFPPVNRGKPLKEQRRLVERSTGGEKKTPELHKHPLGLQCGLGQYGDRVPVLDGDAVHPQTRGALFTDRAGRCRLWWLLQAPETVKTSSLKENGNRSWKWERKKILFGSYSQACCVINPIYAILWFSLSVSNCLWQNSIQVTLTCKYEKKKKWVWRVTKTMLLNSFTFNINRYNTTYSSNKCFKCTH